MSVHKWPDAETVERAARHWAHMLADCHPKVIRVGYFGSSARGCWGVGSDLDLIVIVSHAKEPFERRAARFAARSFPLPAEILVYTQDEWQALLTQRSPFAQTVEREVMWLFERSLESKEDE